MRIVEKIGDLDNRVWCPDCGFGRIVKPSTILKITKENSMEVMVHTAEKHERMHPRHRVDVILYKTDDGKQV